MDDNDNDVLFLDNWNNSQGDDSLRMLIFGATSGATSADAGAISTASDSATENTDSRNHPDSSQHESGRQGSRLSASAASSRSVQRKGAESTPGQLGPFPDEYDPDSAERISFASLYGNSSGLPTDRSLVRSSGNVVSPGDSDHSPSMQRQPRQDAVVPDNSSQEQTLNRKRKATQPRPELEAHQKRRQQIVTRWKRRRFDLRQETDWCGAIRNTVQRFAMHRIQPPTENRNSRTRGQRRDTIDDNGNFPEESMAQDDDDKEETDDDAGDSNDTSDDDDQAAIMNRLLLNSQEAQTSDPLNQNDPSSARVENEFWEQGLTIPPKMKYLLDKYNDHVFQSLEQPLPLQPSAVPSATTSSDQMELVEEVDGTLTFVAPPKPDDKTRGLVSLQEVPPYHEANIAEVSEFFPSSHLFSPHTVKDDRVHQRQLLRLAARHVMTSCSVEGSTQWNRNDQLIGLLWTSDLLSAYWKAIVLYQARLNCRRFNRFATLASKQQQVPQNELADFLGVSCTRQAYGPIHQIGNSLIVAEPTTIRTPKGLEPDKNVHFAAVPGTVPPTPSFPLNATGWIWGPVDRNAYMDHASPIDEPTHLLTLSLLLGRRQFEFNAGMHTSRDETIRSFVTQAVELASKKIHNIPRKSLPRSVKFDRSPLVALNEALLLFASVHANLGTHQSRSSDEDEENHRDNDEEDNDALSSSTKAVAKLIHQTLETNFDRSSLFPFARLKILFGLSQISNAVPDSGAAFLSRSFDDISLRTPFDHIKALLVHLENNRYIDGYDHDNDVSLSVPVLEFAFFQAASSFHSAVEINPTDPFYHSWHIAALAACLLLCSGNRIDNVARAFPSRRQEYHFEEAAAAFGDNVDLLPYEVRIKLSKFEDLRTKIAAAIDLLLDLARHQKSCRASLAIVSLLEWRQVMALVLQDLGTETCATVRTLHSSYAIQWASLDQSNIAKEYLSRIELSQSDLKVFLSESLENNPENIRKWRALVEHLGPLPQREEQQQVGSEPHAVASDCLSKSMDSEAKWMKGRFAHWETDILASGIPEGLSLDGKDKHLLRQEMENLLKECQREERPIDLSDSVSRSLAKNHKNTPVGWFKWVADNNTEGQPSMSDREKTYDNDLPREFTTILDAEPVGTTGSLFTGTLLEADDVGEDLEVLCYKSLIIGHLLGQEKSIIHPINERICTYLATRCWDKESQSIQEDSLEWRCLVWLQVKGVDVVGTSKISANLRSTHHAEPPPPPSMDKAEPKRPRSRRGTLGLYPKEMQDAVVAGMERYGFMKWSLIQKNNPDIFQGYRTGKAKSCYRRMVRVGAIPPHPEDVDASYKRRHLLRRVD